MTGRTALVVEADLELERRTDERAPGGAVTAALCGHWEHDGPCRWPHHSRIDASRAPARLRTVLVVDDGSRDEVVGRIERALRADERWSVLQCAVDRVRPEEASLARSLAGNAT